MGLFLKDPKTCMNPWHGLGIIISVCCLVLLAVFIGQKRHEASQKQIDQTIGSQTITTQPAQPAY